ncbi:MAG: hypothetical protein L6R40_008211 [Gallowayella cf. fulva]|nr:MAG: hypothetical protein L6R40_008211 [Xanthomendoza cf. fulva]
MSTSYTRFYEKLIKHIVPGPNSISYFVPFLLLPSALCIPPSFLSKSQTASIFLPLILACLIHAWSCMGGVDVISVNVLQWSFVLLVCYDPRKTFSRIRRKQISEIDLRKNGYQPEGEVMYEAHPYPTNLSRRIPWVMTLLISLRLTNWKTGDPSHDRKQPVPPLSRTAFCKHAIFLAIQSFIILDITSILVKEDPYFHIPHTSITAAWLPPPSSGFPLILISTLSSIPPRIIRTTIIALQAYALITQGGSLPTIPISSHLARLLRSLLRRG